MVFNNAGGLRATLPSRPRRRCHSPSPTAYCTASCLWQCHRGRGNDRRPSRRAAQPERDLVQAPSRWPVCATTFTATTTPCPARSHGPGAPTTSSSMTEQAAGSRSIRIGLTASPPTSSWPGRTDGYTPFKYGHQHQLLGRHARWRRALVAAAYPKDSPYEGTSTGGSPPTAMTQPQRRSGYPSAQQRHAWQPAQGTYVGFTQLPPWSTRSGQEPDRTPAAQLRRYHPGRRDELLLQDCTHGFAADAHRSADPICGSSRPSPL